MRASALIGAADEAVFEAVWAKAREAQNKKNKIVFVIGRLCRQVVDCTR